MLKQILKFREAILYVIIIILAFTWLIMQIIPQVTELIKTEQKIQKREIELQTVQAKLNKLREEMKSNQKDKEERIKNIYKSEIKFDSQDSEYLVMIDDIVDIIKNNNLKIYALDYNYNVVADEIVAQSLGKYLGCQLTLSLIGNYNQLKDFIIDMIKYPYLVKINSLEIEPYAKDKKLLLSYLKITIYTEQ